MFESKRRIIPSFHPEEHGLIVKLIGQGKRVLDVGCANGYIGRYLVQNGCEVYGIEVDPLLANEARKIYKEVLEVDVEEIDELPYQKKSFDFILYSHVLEHLRRPDRVLNRDKEWLKDDGKVIISLPNIAYWRTRLNLLFGKFDYEEVGIMDRTHLRFFTLDSARRLIHESGYVIDKTYFFGWAMKIFPLKLFPRLFAWYFMFVARKERMS